MPTTPEHDAPANALPAEFAFIGRHFRPLAGPGSLGLSDDAAVLAPPPGREIVIAADAMVEGVHFLPDDPPETIGRKLLRCNLSDLAAMGAQPFGYLLTVSRPKQIDENWFEAFCRGLAEDQQQFGVSLLGGDTTSTKGPLVLSLTILGHVAPGCALRRCGARDGDGLWVTGTIGDGALGLRALLGEIPDTNGWLSERYRLPRPRLGLALHGVAHAAMDVSDGLVQDAGHLARESRLQVTIEADLVPLSPEARALGEAWQVSVLTGGDDYELLLAVPDDKAALLQAQCGAAGIQITRIGRFHAGPPEVRVVGTNSQPITLPGGGWSHF